MTAAFAGFMVGAFTMWIAWPAETDKRLFRKNGSLTKVGMRIFTYAAVIFFLSTSVQLTVFELMER